MLTFRQLDDLPDGVVKIMEDAEQAIINDRARRITRMGWASPATQHQLWRLAEVGAEHDFIVAELAKALYKSEARLYDIFDEAAARALETDDKLYKAAGYSPIPLAQNPWLQQLLKAGLDQTMQEMRNLTRTTASAATWQYEQVIKAWDDAWMKLGTGAFDYKSAIKTSITSLCRDGLAAVKYPSGKVDFLDVATRRAMLTGVNQGAAQVQLANMAQMGTDLVETTAHAGARPEHAVWQGKVFSVSGTHPTYPPFATATGYGTGPGLCGWNCRHSFFPFFEGLSGAAYNPDLLRGYNTREVTYNHKRMSLYDATQEQRYLERGIRRWKREAAALEAAGLDNSEALGKVAEWQAKQRNFIKQTGLRRDYFRERAGRQNLEGPSTFAILRDGNISPIRITQDAIARMRSLNIPGIDTVKLRAAMQDLLQDAANLPAGHEAAAYYDLQFNRLWSEHGALGQIASRDFKKMYYSLHNHPSGETFTHTDLTQLIKNNLQMGAGVAGNDGSAYFLKKDPSYDKAGLLQFVKAVGAKHPDALNKKTVTAENYRAFRDELLRGVGHYGITYYR